jgi:hypothetical protein
MDIRSAASPCGDRAGSFPLAVAILCRMNQQH